MKHEKVCTDSSADTGIFNSIRRLCVLRSAGRKRLQDLRLIVMSRPESDRKRRYQRQVAASKRKLDPIPERTRAQHQYTRRTLIKISDVINRWLDRTEYKPMRGWLPHHHLVTPADEDNMAFLFGIFSENSRMDDTGYLLDLHDTGIRATNRISVLTWYKSDQGKEMLIKKPIYSPLPCDRWNRAPLTLGQWQIIAPSLVAMCTLWQWVHAVREYTKDESFLPGGFTGWHLQPCNKPFSREQAKASGNVVIFESEAEKARGDVPWTGNIIYRHVIDEYSAHVDTGSDTPCPQ